MNDDATTVGSAAWRNPVTGKPLRPIERRPRYFNIPGTWARTLWFCQCSWCESHDAIETLLAR